MKIFSHTSRKKYHLLRIRERYMQREERERERGHHILSIEISRSIKKERKKFREWPKKPHSYPYLVNEEESKRKEKIGRRKRGNHSHSILMTTLV